MILKRIGPMSCAKVSAILNALIGLIAGFFFSLFGLIGTAMGGADGAMGALFGVGAIIFMPILYAVFGFIGGLIGAAIYNLVVNWVGGIEMDFDMPPAQQPPPQPRL